MATAQELVSAVRRVVRDKSYTDETILGLLNQGINEIAGWDNNNPDLGPVGQILLPMLETSDTVVTGTDPYVDLPAGYMRNLYAVTYAGMNSPVSIHSGLARMMEAWDSHLDHAGPAEDVTIRGAQLYYQPIPVDATTLILFYYAKPTPLVLIDALGDTDIPVCLPEELHIPLLVNYAASEIFNEIEQGLDGDKTNTKLYSGRFLLALGKLFRSVRHKSKQIQAVRRTSRYF